MSGLFYDENHRGLGSIYYWSGDQVGEGRKTRPEWPRGWTPPHQLKAAGPAEPGRQTILHQFQVKKAGLVIPFHEFVGNGYY